MSPRKNLLGIPLLLLLLIVLSPHHSHACDRSELSLVSVGQVGTEFEIVVNLSVGGGVLGAITGADNFTSGFVFGFFSSAVGTINFSQFTPSVTGDSTGSMGLGISTGPTAFGPYQLQGGILYNFQSGLFVCTSSTAICGRPHTQTDQYFFRSSVMPDSIRVFGIEGAGNPLAGCIPDQDMLIDFTSFGGHLSIACPPNQQLTNCVFDDYTGLATVTDTTDPNPVVTQQPPAGTAPFGTTTQVTLFATNNSMQSSSCTFLVTTNLQPLSGGVSVDTTSNGLSILCPGGVSGLATVTANGGCGTYTYLWSNGATTDTTSGFPAGIISVTITDSAGGMIGRGATVTEPPALQSNLPPNLTTCTGNTATFNVGLSGGNGGREYCVRPIGSSTETCFQESTGNIATVTGFGPGTYVGTVRDNEGCEAMDTFMITAVSSPVVNLGADTSICQGQVLTLDAGNPGTLHVWSTGDSTQTVSVTASGTYSVDVVNTNGCASADTIIVTLLPSPQVSLGSDTTICQGQSITFDAGNSGSTFLWNTSATSQTITANTSGTYAVLVDNGNGCTGGDSIILTVLPNPAVSIGADTALCPGQSLLLNAGNPGASYLWSNNSTSSVISVSSAGTYSVAVNAGGCIGSDTLVLSNLPSPAVSLGADTTFCAGGALTLDAGNSGASYLWNTAATTQMITVNTTGSYGVAVTGANGCTGSDSIVVIVASNPVVNLGADTVLCDGNGITLFAGNSGSTFLWSTGDTGAAVPLTSGGVYSVTVTTAQGCIGFDTIVVDTNFSPFAAYSVAAGVGNQAFDFSDLSSGDVTGWVWDFGDGVTSSLQNPNHIYAAPGTYQVCLTVNGPCGNSTTCQATVVTGLGAIAQQDEMELFPNPSNGSLSVRFGMEAIGSREIQVFDLAGKVLFATEVEGNSRQLELDLNELPSGMYFLRSQGEYGRAVKRFEIQP